MEDRLASSTLSARSKANIRKLGLQSGESISSPSLSSPTSSRRRRTAVSSPSLQPPPPTSPPPSEAFNVQHIERKFESTSAEHTHVRHVHHGHAKHVSKTKARVEDVLARQSDAAHGGGRRAELMEAGAHLWLAEELRAAASMLSDGKRDPTACAERLDELSQSLQKEACMQRWNGGDGAYGGEGGVAHASRAASMVHRAAQLRHVARAVLEYAQALRHGGARGWVTVFGEGGVDACNPTVVPTLLSLADSETAIARAHARPQSRPSTHDHAHAPLSYEDPGRSPAAATMSAHDPKSSEVVNRARSHCRRRLSAAHEGLQRDASLIADVPSLLPPRPPDPTNVALRVLAGGGYATGLPTGLGWSEKRRPEIGSGEAPRVRMWGSTINPQHGGGAWLGAGWRWRGGMPGGSDSSDDDDEDEERQREEAARRARKALRAAKRLSNTWEPEKGVCVRCVEREVGQVPTLLAT